MKYSALKQTVLAEKLSEKPMEGRCKELGWDK